MQKTENQQLRLHGVPVKAHDSPYQPDYHDSFSDDYHPSLNVYEKWQLVMLLHKTIKCKVMSNKQHYILITLKRRCDTKIIKCNRGYSFDLLLKFTSTHFNYILAYHILLYIIDIHMAGHPMPMHIFRLVYICMPNKVIYK